MFFSEKMARAPAFIYDFLYTHFRETDPRIKGALPVYRYIRNGVCVARYIRSYLNFAAEKQTASALGHLKKDDWCSDHHLSCIATTSRLFTWDRHSCRNVGHRTHLACLQCSERFSLIRRNSALFLSCCKHI